MNKSILGVILAGLLYSCTKTESTIPNDARIDVLKIKINQNGSNFLENVELYNKYMNVQYLVNNIVIDYPYSNVNFPKGYRVVKLNNEKILEVHLSSSSKSGAKTLLSLTADITDTITANFLSEGNSIRYSKVWYNGNIVFDTESEIKILPNYIEVEIK